jgi:hypothetical protein
VTTTPSTNPPTSKRCWPQAEDHPALHPHQRILAQHGQDSFSASSPRRAIHRGSFISVQNLIDTIRSFIDGYNDHCHPFTWTKDADTILVEAQQSPKAKDSALT